MKLRSPKAQAQRPVRPEAPLPQAHGYAAVREQLRSSADAPRPARGRRWRRVLFTVLVLCITALLATGGWFAFASVGAVHATAITNDATPAVRVDVRHALFGVHATNVRVSVDGRTDAAARVTTSGAQHVTVTPHRLSDGPHTIRVTISSVGAFRRTLHASRTVTVDTVAPRGKLTQPSTSADATAYVPAHVAAVTTRPAHLVVDAEAGSTVTLTSSAASFHTKHVTADALASDGTWNVVLPEGAQQLTLRVRDAAGNVTRVHRRVLVDTVGPALRAPIPVILRSNELGLTATARDPHGVQLQLRMDGTVVDDALTRTVLTPAPQVPASVSADGGAGDGTATRTANGSGDDASDGSDDDADPLAASFHIVLPSGAFEGRHTIQLIATDSLGATTKVTKHVLVDSTESLDGAAGLRPGARGADVVQLQQALIAHTPALRSKLAAELRARVYGAQTTAAVKSYQSNKGVDADGVAGSDTLAALTLKIVVNRASHTLTLYRAGKVVRTFSVAVGSAKYPTIPGDFSIVNMQKDPTWTPPDSAWAKNAKPVGPGAGNPLGTRWMGLGGSVGIHGTDDPASIGFSVSHGCIRMQIPDAEALYDLVRVGTPVQII